MNRFFNIAIIFSIFCCGAISAMDRNNELISVKTEKKDNQEGEKLHKLVRDKIPEIYLSKTGKESEIEILHDDAAYLDALNKKLIEEVGEFIESLGENSREREMEEMADVLEVIDAIYAFRGYDKQLIQDCKLAKNQERGGFEKRIMLYFDDYKNKK